MQKRKGSELNPQQSMQVKVLFFGATADSAGLREAEIELRDGSNAQDALAQIMGAFEGLRASHSESQLHFSINQEYSDGTETIRDGDELAVFTAVSGG